MTLHVDMRKGSCNLPPYLRSLGLDIIEGIGFPTDVEFLGSTPLGDATPIGIEHKSAVTGDIFTSMSDNRILDQLSVMAEHYPHRRYIVIEGNLRRSKDGVLEVWKFNRDSAKYEWTTAYSRNGRGWTYDEFENRIESIQEFWSEPYTSGLTVIKQTYDVYESAAYIAGRYHYWRKPYGEHQSARQWDRASKLRGEQSNDSPLMARNREDKSVSLTREWAARLDDIGPVKSLWVERHFGPKPLPMVLASEKEWAEVEYRDKAGKRRYHFGPDTIRSIMRQIGTAKDGEGE